MYRSTGLSNIRAALATFASGCGRIDQAHHCAAERERQAMSKSDLSLPGDWWWIAAYMEELLFDTKEYQATNVHWMRRYGRAGVILEGDYDTEPPLLQANTLRYDIRLICRINGQEGATTINTTAWPPFHGYWTPILDRVSRYTQTARQIRRYSVGTTADMLIEEFNRAKAAGHSVTLRQLAEETGISYDYLRKLKSKKERALMSALKEESRTVTGKVTKDIEDNKDH
jgi:hypothetical protein